MRFTSTLEPMLCPVIRWEESGTEDCDVLIVAYGTPSRIAMSAMEVLEKEKNIKAGLFRPITLWPFPGDRLRELSERENIKAVFVVEMSLGQMLDDVRLAVNGKKQVKFFGRAGGSIPALDEIVNAVGNVLKEVK